MALEIATPALDPSQFGYDASNLGDMKISEVFPDPNTWLPAYLNFGKPLVNMPHPGEEICLALFGGGMIFVIIYTLIVLHRNLKRKGGLKSWWPLFVLLGSFLAIFYETFDCTTLHCLYPQVGGINIMTIWGMSIPLYLGFIYPCYVAFAIIMMFDWIDRGLMTKKVYWIFTICSFIGAFAFEPIALYFGMWNYWGPNEPFRVLDFPFYWFFGNPAMIVVVAAVIRGIWHDVLDRKHTWSLILLLPFFVIGIHIAIMTPVQLAINTTLDMNIVNAAAVATCVLSILVVMVGAKMNVKENDEMLALMKEKGLDMQAEQHPWKTRKAAKAKTKAGTATA